MSLLALPGVFRFCVYNGLQSSISNFPVGMPTINGVRVTDSGGTIVFDTNTTFFSTAQVSIGPGSYVVGSAFSNSSGWRGGDFVFSAFASGSLSGTLQLFLEVSPDSANWPSPTSSGGIGGGLLIAALGWASTLTISTASTTRTVNFFL